MLLHLIRHAKTDQESPTGKDFDRELLSLGWQQCAELSTYLTGELDFTTFRVICSSAKRSRQTLEGLSANFSEEETDFTEELYLCSVKTYFKLIWQENHPDDLVLIGHNFGISDLANYFLDTQIEMRTAEYICIKFPFDSWDETFQSNGILKSRFRPSAR